MISIFRELVRTAMEIAGPGTVDPEPSFNSVLDFVLAHPEQREEFGACFVEMVRDPNRFGDGCDFLVKFCMHELRYEEVRAAMEEGKWVNADRNPPDMRKWQYFASLLDAFDDDGWGDNFFRRFGAPPDR